MEVSRVVGLGYLYKGLGRSLTQRHIPSTWETTLQYIPIHNAQQFSHFTKVWQFFV